MPEESQELRRINWTECFGFTQIFRTFRLAVHPSKIVLALAGLVLTVVVGTILDGIWCASGQSVMPGEIIAYIQGQYGDQWRADRLREGKAVVGSIIASGRVVKKDKDLAEELEKGEDFWKLLGDMPDRIREHYDGAVKDIRKAKKAEDLQKLCLEWAVPDQPAVPAEIAQDVDKLREHAIRLARTAHQTALVRVQTLQRRGVFRALLAHERDALRQAVEASCALNFNGMMADVMANRGAAELLATPSGAGPGLFPSLVLMALGFKWFLSTHWLFAVIFLLLSLAIWAFFGGAICRIAAMHAAREEKISIKQAMDFSRRKFVGFFAAPLIPLGLIIVIGICLLLGGIVGSIPYIGEILVGLFFLLALVAGFVMALVLIGGIAGGSLMWPTIAVEGSDSFDAISRSFSYVYSRPWRSLFYFLVACVYGAFCFLFVRVFALIMLKLTHFFVGVGMMMVTSREAIADDASKLDAMWRGPSFEGLMPAWAFLGREHWDILGGFGIWCWVALTVATTYAFLLSFYFSGSTVLYYLLRREVDATDLEDVYLEETEEEEPAPAPAPVAAQPGAAPSTTPPPEPPPPPTSQPGAEDAGGPSGPPSEGI